MPEIPQKCCLTCHWMKEWSNKQSPYTCMLTRLPIVHVTQGCLGWKKGEPDGNDNNGER